MMPPPSSLSSHSLPRSRTLRPIHSYSSLTAASLASDSPAYVTAKSSLQPTPDRSLESLVTAPESARSWTGSRSRNDSGECDAYLSTAKGPMLSAEPSMSSFASTSTTSELVISPSDPYPSPLYSAPIAPIRQLPSTANKENVPPTQERPTSPHPRPTSPLRPVPTARQQPRLLAASSSQSDFPTPLTSHNSLAAFKAAHGGYAASSSQGGCSSDTHRTSSDVDLDLSFERDSRRTSGASAQAMLGVELIEEGFEEHRREKRDWVRIDVAPADHDIPESQLMRSSSGQLVGARHARATSALDLRAQFKAVETALHAAHAPHDVAITMDVGALAEDEAEHRRKREVREGKRPIEGPRAGSSTAPLPATERFAGQPSKRSSIGRGFAYHTTGIVEPPPHSAPAVYRATFASQQEQRNPVDARQNKGFPMPLRLLQRKKRSAEALFSSAMSAASAWTHRSGRHDPGADSELDSVGPSPLFDSDVEGTNRTAPSTPNDTPVLQECFELDDLAPPVPHRLGNSFHPNAPLAGLGFDFGGEEIENQRSTVVPLRQSRRVSLPPTTAHRRSIGHNAIPSLSLSPPRERPSEDSSITLSTIASQDSALDPTVSPSRRLSRRLSSSDDVKPKKTVSVHFDRIPHSATASRAPRDPQALPFVQTPAHLLVTPTPKSTAAARSPSFSFSPAPLRLVKIQLLRAAGYTVSEEPVATPADPPTDGKPDATTLDVDIAHAEPRRPTVWDDVTDLLSSSPATWLDEVVPAKLAFVAGFLMPWLWILGGCAVQYHPSGVKKQASTSGPADEEMYAGLDRWIFLNRVAAGGGGVAVSVFVAIAIWAACTA
ncbi:hypothetical protein Rt10032_c01g0310 [Rhodotorula toruloides]|uniref:Uncharacterized protein n=1 Tax=Rhodotorula toruloides TaxID=5286 RepID=A0A511K7G6_RHOTO|nr:hypothetical protein Rt10032_c01g0310 [Rhodotorula toruloides]